MPLSPPLLSLVSPTPPSSLPLPHTSPLSLSFVSVLNASECLFVLLEVVTEDCYSTVLSSHSLSLPPPSLQFFLSLPLFCLLWSLSGSLSSASCLSLSKPPLFYYHRGNQPLLTAHRPSLSYDLTSCWTLWTVHQQNNTF